MHLRGCRYMYIQYFDKVSLESEKLWVSNIIEIYILIILHQDVKIQELEDMVEDLRSQRRHRVPLAGGEVTLELQNVGNILPFRS